MNDLKALHEVGALLDPPRTEPSGQLRDRVLSEMASRSRRRRLPLTRFGWRLAATGGLAVALAAGLIGMQVMGVGGHAPLSAEAAEIFENAALVALQTSTVTPRPDQFVYVESATAYGTGTAAGTGKDGDAGPPTGWVISEKLRRAWFSVDGTGDGLVRERPESDPKGWSETPMPGCVDGKVSDVAGGKAATANQDQGCEPRPAYLGDLPTDPENMYDYLYRNSHGGNPADEQAFITVGDLIRENYVPPKAMAAMFRAAAKIHGTTVVRDVVDPAGRKGVAVAYTGGSRRRELIFDPKTYEYLGERAVAVEDIDAIKKGGLIGGAARLTVAIVDKPGQLP